MKFNLKIKISIIIILGISFASIILKSSCVYKTANFYRGLESNDNSKSCNINIKQSKVSEIIYINNWSAAKIAGICTGNGTYSNPYVIEDLIIDGEGSGTCIQIFDTTDYFRIENCTVSNSIEWLKAGIRLTNVRNGYLIDNDCSFNYIGINLESSTNCTISENIVNCNLFNGIWLTGGHNSTVSRNIGYHNNANGIHLYYSHNNIVLENNVSNNGSHGICIAYSDNNNISRNNANDNFAYGIMLGYSSCNYVSGNTLFGNSKCIEELYCQENIIKENSYLFPIIFEKTM